MKQSSAIVKTGIIAGTLDIAAAFIHFFISTRSNPLTILKYIASAIFGKAAFSGGALMIFAGLALHYFIALSFTIFFFWIYPRISLISKHKFAAGIIYGILVWMVMNLLVVPLSRIPARPFDLVNAVTNMFILIVCIGIPISLMAHRHFQGTKAGS